MKDNIDKILTAINEFYTQLMKELNAINNKENLTNGDLDIQKRLLKIKHEFDTLANELKPKLTYMQNDLKKTINVSKREAQNVS